MQTLLRIPVSEENFSKLEAQAKIANKPVEYLIAERIPQITKHNEKPLIIEDVDRQKMEKLLGKNFTTAAELISIIQRITTYDIDGVKLELTPYLLDRLKSRCIGMEFEKFIPMIIKRSLEEYAGLR